MLTAGSKAPAFTLDDLSGAKHSLDELLSRGPVLLAIYKISCPTCQMTMPYLDRLARGSLQIVGISQDDERGTQRFRDTFHLRLPTLLDRDRDGYPVSNAFGITHVPALFLVEQDGSISLAATGFSKPDLESIGERAGVETFRQDENVPEWKAG